MRMSQKYAYVRNIRLSQEYEFESGIYTCQEYTLKSGICDCQEYALGSRRCTRSFVSGICIGVRFMNVGEEYTPYVVWTFVVKGTVCQQTCPNRHTHKGFLPEVNIQYQGVSAA
jgi:hypothetical protein